MTVESVNFVPERTVIKEEKKEGYKFLEVMVIFSAVVVVGLLALLAINPSKEAADARNMKRSADISSILNTVASYGNKYEGLPEEVPVDNVCVNLGNEICKTGPYDCADLVNMNFLSNGNTDILVQMPQDPLYVSINGTGYYISQNGKGLVTVCAPHAERSEKISFSKLMY